MKPKFKIKPLLLALYPLIYVASVSSAEQVIKDTQKKEEPIEVVEVTGYRGSVIKAISDKRNSDTIVDSIFSEDIGKNTDQNIADAMSRITGVSIQTEGGEGTKISVRGMGADLNNISLNGVTLTSSDENQGVDLSAYSSDILSSIQVYKTSSADQDEGALGANVVLKSIKPLNIRKDRSSFEVQGRYNDYNGKYNHKLSGTLSRKFFDETFGFVITATDETNSVRRDEESSSNTESYSATTIRAGGAKDLAGDIITEERQALFRPEVSYNLNQNQRDRRTISAGFQFVPLDSTDIQLNLVYSDQDIITDNHELGVEIHDQTEVNQDGDPQQDWWTLNTKNNTLVKTLGRHNGGFFKRKQGEANTKNKSASLDIEHYFTDDFVMNVNLGYSKTDYTKVQNGIGSNTWKTIPRSVRNATPVGALEPVGYDCSTGSCQIVTGTHDLIFVNDNTVNGSNIATSSFNPLDVYGSHLTSLRKTNDATTDINKSLFVDFQWDIYTDLIESVEFGMKLSQRDKDVYRQTENFTGSDVTLLDDDGNVIPTGNVSDLPITVALSGEQFPFDDFMSGILNTSSQYNSDYLKGWALLDSDKGFIAATGIPDANIRRDDSGARRTIQDNYSAYTKLNFTYFDDKLKGNLGFRFVHTETESNGASAIEYYSKDRAFTPHELRAVGLFDTSNPECTPAYEDLSGEERTEPFVPGDTPCHDPQLAYAWVDENDRSTWIPLAPGDALPPGTDGRKWGRNIRHNDRSTFGDNALRSYDSNDGGEYDVWLPSLNLNYAITPELIGRFAASRTMARPSFEDLRPSFSVRENAASGNGGVSTITIPDSDLKPAESTNFDVSLEWYFNQTSLLSLGFYHRDVVNFTEKVFDNFYFKDFRADYDRSALSIDELLINIDPALTPENSGCMPSRVVTRSLQKALDFGCEVARGTLIRNGKGATTKGVEFAYAQSFDFLPGAFSGLGVNFNYTWANSETDAEVLEATGRLLKALPQAYTPEHTVNTALYWQQDGHSVKLSHRYSSMQLVNRGQVNGAIWRDGLGTLDLSAVYKVNDNFDISFNALNLTDAETRTFFTSTSTDLGDRLQNADGDYLDIDDNVLPDGHNINERVVVPFDEGNPMADSSVDTSKTVSKYRTGRQFRLSIRGKF